MSLMPTAASAPVSPARSPVPPAVPAASPAVGDIPRRTLSDEEAAKVGKQLENPQ